MVRPGCRIFDDLLNLDFQTIDVLILSVNDGLERLDGVLRLALQLFQLLAQRSAGRRIAVLAPALAAAAVIVGVGIGVAFVVSPSTTPRA